MTIRTKRIIVVVVLITALLVYGLYRAAVPTTAVIRLAPTVATMRLDGTKTISAGGHHLSPGAHTIVATMNGFATNTKKFTVPASGSVTVDVLLDPNSPVGYEYLKQHPHEETLREQLGGAIFKANGQKAVAQTPIIKVLPYVAADNTYRIDYGAGSASGTSVRQTIYITASSDTSANQALKWIVGKGYAISTLQIVTTIEPMLAHLPYQTTDYSLTAGFVNVGESNQPKLVINATILLSHADESNQAAAIANYKQEVVTYIQSCGVDPGAYTINYNVQSA